MFVIPASLSLCPRGLWIQIPRRPGSTVALSHVLTLPETFSGCLQRGGGSAAATSAPRPGSVSTRRFPQLPESQRRARIVSGTCVGTAEEPVGTTGNQ